MTASMDDASLDRLGTGKYLLLVTSYRWPYTPALKVERSH